MDKRLKILRKIAKSDFSNIYLAENKGKKYVLKECFPEKLVIRLENGEIFTEKNKKNFELVKKSFLKEGEIIKKLNKKCKKVIKLEKIIEKNNTIYLLLQYFNGMTLKEYILNEKNIKIDEIIKIFLEIIDVIEKIHKNNVIHRDIKPTNIMINKNKEIKIIDFNMSSYKNEENEFIKISEGYSPVEFYSINNKNREESDIYSVFALLYFMINKKKVDNIEKRFYENNIKFYVNIDEKLKKIIEKGLELNIEKRFKNIKEVKKEIKKLKII